MIHASPLPPPPMRRKPRDAEHGLQCRCVRWLRLQYPKLRPLLFAIPNGGLRSKATAGRLKGEGVVAGVADMMLAVPSHPWHGLFIEMKTEEDGSRQSLAQREWQTAVEAAGYRYVVCRSLDGFMLSVNEYLKTIKPFKR